MNNRCILLLSGGMDSTSLLGKVLIENWDVYPVIFDYGQKHRAMENEAAEKVWDYYKKEYPNQLFSYKILKIDLTQIGNSALTDSKIEVPNNMAEQPKTVVPHRNLLMTTMASAYGMSLGVYDIFITPVAEDQICYFDCKPTFYKPLSETLSASVGKVITVHTPFVSWWKKDIVAWGLLNKVPYHLCYSCYRGDYSSCGSCPACVKEGQRVLMSDFSWMPIEKINIGDKILTFNEKTFQFELSFVLNKINNGKKDVVAFKSDKEKVYLTLDHRVSISTKGSRLRWRELGSLKRKDASYFSYLWDSSYIPVAEKDFALGYLKGFVDGDGTCGNRSVGIYQKTPQPPEEVISLYNKFVRSTSSTVKFSQKGYKRSTVCYANMGYTPLFLKVINFHNSKSFYLGYLNGIVITDGSVTYNKSNSVINCQIPQRDNQVDTLSNIAKCLIALNIPFNISTGITKGKDSFNKDGARMVTFQFRRCWKIPLRYGGKKKEDILNKLLRYKIYSLTKKRVQKDVKDSIKNATVYDLTTTAGSFICEGFLVHNCLERLHAFASNGVPDPISYAKSVYL